MSRITPSTNHPEANDGRTLAVTEGSRSVGTASIDASGVIQHQRQIRNAVLLRRLYAALYSESHAAMVLRVAKAFLAENPSLTHYPEHLPTLSTRFETKPSTFWTCAFFPGCLLALAERLTKFPKCLPLSNEARPEFHAQLLDLCQSWCEPLHQNAIRTDTHDLGFMMQPLRMQWELIGDRECLDSVITAANNLSSRYNGKTKAIRSWNLVGSKSYEIYDMTENFLVIIDSMANLDILFYVGNYTGAQELIDVAKEHAQTVIRTLLRPDFTTYHVVNMDPNSGEIKSRFTHQGYNDSSCWSRGQAWALLGFVQTYIWTDDHSFLVVAMSIANKFVQYLSRSQLPQPYVPAWDFNAPSTDGMNMLRDTSAGMIAANGLLLLHQSLQGQSPFFEAVQRIIEDTLAYSLSDTTSGIDTNDIEDAQLDQPHTAILSHSTANNNENATVRYADHGYVVADYYFLELGNKLLRMGYFG